MLDSVRMGTQKVSKAEYKVRFKELVNRLVVLQQEAKKKELGTVVLFEGWKGAGKGSRISDLLYHLDARDTSVYVTEDFDDKEAALVLDDDFGATGYYPFLQQFWKALGQRGSMTFYDRGWYSVAAQHIINTLPKKGKGKLSKKERGAIKAHASRMVKSIEDFETQLRNDGYLVIKFFLQISEKTQRERLISLYSDPATSWRVSRKDLEHLEDYDRTYQVYDEMLDHSNFKIAPWILLDAEDHRRVNLSVVQTIVNALEKELSDVGPLPALEKYIPISVPAELLERRPDIIAAEYKLHAATAKIGNARADYYPKFSITGNISYEAPKIGNIVQNQYGSWSVGPNVSWNIFQAGKTVYNVKLQEALTREAGVNWEDAVLTAIKEVEDALVSAEKERARIEHLNRMVENYRKAFELSRELYTQGEIEFIDLLEAQRSMLSSAQNQVLSRKDFIGYIIMLDTSLGGGWTEADVADEPENLEWIFFDSLGDNPERTAAAEK